MAPLWILLLLISVAGAVRCPDGTTCGQHRQCCALPDRSRYGCCPLEEGVSRSLPMVLSQTSCSDCPDEYSCVSTPQGRSACCPLPQGSSCQDGHHCCPSGTQCSEDGHSCHPASNLTAIICPDGRSECPNDATCCVMPDRSWGCCPLPLAVCCNDHLHCCPHDTVCDLQHGRCASADGYIPWMSKLPAQVGLGSPLQRTNCGDGSSCPDGTSCCLQKDLVSFGCCPFMSAVCCSDHIHCCPSGMTCDLTHLKCQYNGLEIPLYTKLRALRDEAHNVQCDSQYSCPDQNTCCRLASGEWGCCPLPQAVCCSDHIHCCPSGSTCSGGQCVSGEVSIPWLSKTPALKHEAHNVQCDSQYSCPDQNTCCRLASGEWGCCPLPQAVCCSDHIHCCPSGSTCSGGQCVSGEVSIPWLSKTPALKHEVQCDESTSCAGTQTCCRMESGEWGCCPFPKAVCCADEQHCCPSGFTCNAGQCISGARSVPWERKTPALGEGAHNVQCDSQSSCPDQNTCCRLASGEWGCCPLPQAVCCSDHIHCCPSGSTCSGGQCVSGEVSIPWLSKTPALKHEAHNVQCDSQYSCPDQNTCCRLASGEWGCCPLPQAVCCSDHIHCCPSGSTCSGGQCVSGEVSIPWLSKTPALKHEAHNVQCDSQSSCPDQNTCCRLASGEWGCCPLPQAVCCLDHIHCCPSGSTCSGGQCVSGEVSIPWLSKTPALKHEVENVQCDDQHSCLDSQTCCRFESGTWGCCPFAQATCCSDHWHCCPRGFSCDEQGSCVNGQLSIPWLKKSLVNIRVKCNDSYSCPSGTTCCPAVDGGWACCPLEQAVCCTDNQHCCPNGYVCDLQAGTCNKPQLALTPASVRQPVGYVWCDAQYVCSDGTTCCRARGGLWSCCPYTQAVCCPDMIHCCPYGYVCLGSGIACGRSGGLRWDGVTHWIKPTPLL